MTTRQDASIDERQEAVWAAIDREHRKDRFVKRLSVVAWSATAVILLVFAGFIGRDVAHTARLAEIGAVRSDAVLDALMPLIAVLGSVSLLVAVLATIGVFLRLRTASLSEIQHRLAALESAILDRPEAAR